MSGDTQNSVGGVNGHVVQATHIGQLSIMGAPEPLPVPRQLPPINPGLTGRAEQLAALDGQLTGGTGIAVVVGTAGVGKTSLVVWWAQRVQHCFPDGTLYVNLNGYGPGVPATASDVLAEFLLALGCAPHLIPPHLGTRMSLYRTLLAHRRVLILLDNVNDVAQVRPLLPGGSGCVVVVTSRADLKGLVVKEGALHIRLPLFTEQEALDLVRAVLGTRRVDAEPDAVVALVRACARLPLALRIAAGRVATHSHLTVGELVAELESDRERWSALSVPADEYNAVRTMFDWSYHRLPAEQALMFRRLGLCSVPSIGAHAAAAVSGLGLREAKELLAGLAEQHLVEPAAQGHYTCHDLLRAYATDLAELDDDRHEARLRQLEWYAHHARNAYRLFFPDRIGHLAGSGVVTRGHPEIAFTGPDDVWKWASGEFDNAVAAVRATAHSGASELTMLTAVVFSAALGLIGRWDDALEVCGIGMNAARQLGDRKGELSLSQNLAHFYRRVDRWEESDDVLRSGLALARELDDDSLVAEALCNLGSACFELERYTEARQYLEEALVLCADTTPGRPHCVVEFVLSGVCAGLGDHEQALRHAERFAALVAETGIKHHGVYVLYAVARARQVAGAHAEAIVLCEQALGEATMLSDPREHALLLHTFGESLRQTGRTARAAECWREALAIFEERGDHRAPRLRKQLRELETKSSVSAG